MTEPRPSPAARRLWALQTFILLFAVWLALNGLEVLLIGLLLAAAGAAVGAWLVPGEPYPWRPLRLLAFAAYFLGQSLRGGGDVAWRALHPRLPLAPCRLMHVTALPPGLPRTAFASIVSLLPGTLAVELHEDGRIDIHALDGIGVPAALAALETRIAWLFSLDEAARR